VCCAQQGAGAPACAGSCAASDTLRCLTPDDCGGATPDCCGTLVVNGGLLPNCNAQSFTTQCVASCTSNLVGSCTATDTMHLCTDGSDCAKDTANPNCCLLGGHQVCISNGTKALIPLIMCK
jgi:hypothetical protein